LSELDLIPTRENIDALQSAMAQLPQAQLETRHYWADGMYCRELVIPKGCTLVGKVHRREHFSLLLKGRITLVCDGQRQMVKAPAIFVSPAGIKRAGYAHKTCVFVNVHRTNSRDLKEIEREVIEDDPTALYDERNELRLLA
jgi:hypothetical protein